MVDDHVSGGKMIVEMSQMLANCYSEKRLADNGVPRAQKGTSRQHSYYNHPCSIWVRSSLANFKWCVHLGLEMGYERHYRTGSGHYSTDFIRWCENHTPDLNNFGLTTPALVMPDFCKSDDAVESYRTLYRNVKKHLARWTNRNKPFWW